MIESRDRTTTRCIASLSESTMGNHQYDGSTDLANELMEEKTTNKAE
jgi:hypothetical protein